MLYEMIAPDVTVLRQVREDRELYVPDYMTGDPHEASPEAYSAANEHAAELREAEQHLDDALNLAGTLRASVKGEDDGRAMQADTVLKFIERELKQAHRCIDSHDTRHLNLFLAYCDLRDGSSDRQD